MGAHALATIVNLAKRIPTVGMNCEILWYFGRVVSSCPLPLFAREKWEGSTGTDELWQGTASSAMDFLARTADVLDSDQLREFLAIMWEHWNSRNQVIFGKKDGKMGVGT